MTEDNTAKTSSEAELFLDGLVKIVTDLDKGGKQDADMVARIGSLANRLIDEAGTYDWTDFKEGLSNETRASLIGTFSREIEASGNQGDIRTAYAMQAVAASLVGDRFADERIAPGVALLDRFIEAAHVVYLRNIPKPH